MPNGAQYQNIASGYKGPWVDELLQAIGAPTTDSNRAALRAWAASEGTLQSNNPLAISGQGVGATTCLAQCGSSSPVYAYSSAQQGVQNTASFLQGSYYAGVVGAFKADAGLSSIWNAINSSPWCTGCQGGAYPEVLGAAIGKGGNPVLAGYSNAQGKSTAPAATPFLGHQPSDCALGTGGNALFGLLGSQFNVCLLNYGQLRAILGGTLMGIGGLTMVVGLALVAAYGLKSTAARALIPSGVQKGSRGATRASQEASETAPADGEEAFEAGRQTGQRQAEEAERARFREEGFESDRAPSNKPAGPTPAQRRAAQRRREEAQRRARRRKAAA